MLLFMSTASPARSQTVILKDGTFVEGEIIRETSRTVRIDTRFGTRTFLKKDIERIVESVGQADLDANRFHELPPVIRTVLNAQADYKLGDYDKAYKRLEPYRDYKEQPAIRIRIDWLFIDLYQRQGRWDQARRLLEDKLENGTPREKVRAKAHLDIFEINPQYDLRYVGERHARNFISDEKLLELAREPGSLRDHRIMRAALEEYCEQLLVQDELSVKAFADRLNFDQTYEAVKNAPLTGDLTYHLPYVNDLKKAEASLYKAQSILDDYGAAFELDLVRTELDHLLTVVNRMINELLESSPEGYNPPVDSVTGRLTADGRREWVRRCDEFVDLARPLERLLAYMMDKAERYPRDLELIYRILTEFKERMDQVVKAVRRNRDRTHG
jgi:hypothetical protein